VADRVVQLAIRPERRGGEQGREPDSCRANVVDRY